MNNIRLMTTIYKCWSKDQHWLSAYFYFVCDAVQ